MICERVDELAGAAALGALERDEERALLEHVESCTQPHAELRSILGMGPALASALEPIAPSPALRDRVMASVAATAQEHAPAPGVAMLPSPAIAEERHPGWLDWLSPGWARGLAAAALLAVVVLGAWNVAMQGQMAEARRVADALAGAETVYSVTGQAGRGLLLDTPEGPRFLATDLAEAPSGRLYELWLIPTEGTPVDVGVLGAGDTDMVLVPLDDDLAGYATFAVTLEESRVETPTSDPVLVASLDTAGS